MSPYPEKIQVTYYELCPEPCDPNDDPGYWIFNSNRTRRLKVSEAYLVADIDRRAQNYPRLLLTSCELEYRIIGESNDVTLDENDCLVFKNAGIRCMTEACGPAFDSPEKTELVPSASFRDWLRVAGKVEADPPVDPAGHLAGSRILADLLSSELSGSYPRAFGWVSDSANQQFLAELTAELEQAQLAGGVPTIQAVSRDDREVWNIKIESAILKEPTRCSVALEHFNPELWEASNQATSDRYDPGNSASCTIAPLFWFPLVKEAFAVGAITRDDGYHFFGRLGNESQGYRVAVGKIPIAYDRNGNGIGISFGRDCDDSQSSQCDYSKFAVFRLEAVPANPHPIKLTLFPVEQSKLYAVPVPFYVGAMPVDDPTSIADLESLEAIECKPRMAYLTGKIKLPVKFDPQIVCPPCY